MELAAGPHSSQSAVCETGAPAFCPLRLCCGRGASFQDVEGTSHEAASGNRGDEFAVGAAAVNYGLRAEHGFASVFVASALICATAEDGEEVQADFIAALACVAGDITGSNPAGMGSASWRGIAEAVETSTYRSRFGTATVTIPDLSRPSVDVDIALAGRRIGSSARSGSPLQAGRCETGVSGRDRFVGDLHGPAHQETWGVFDTGAYIGAYAATRSTTRAPSSSRSWAWLSSPSRRRLSS